MTKDNSKVIIKFKEKEYEIEPKEAQQKVKPKNGKDSDKEITVKDYKAGKWNHTCQCSENGTDFEEVVVKWGGAKHATIWGGTGLTLISIIGLAWWYFSGEEEKNN